MSKTIEFDPALTKEYVIGMAVHSLRSDVDELTDLVSDVSPQDAVELELIAHDLVRLIGKIKFKLPEAAE